MVDQLRLVPHQQKLVILVALLAFALRLFHLGEWSFWHDEAVSVLLAQKPPVEVVLITAADVHPPLYYLLLKGFLIFGQNEFVVRFLSALCGAGSVWMIYLLGRDLFNASTGLIGALLMALSPLQVFYGQEARMYTLLLLFITFAVWCFMRALDNNRWIWWGLFALGITLAAYTAYFTFPIIAAMSLYIFLVDKRRDRIFKFLLAIVITVLLYLPWLTIFYTQAQSVLGSYWMERPHPLILFTTLSGFFIGVTLTPFWIMTALAVTLFLLFAVFSNVYHALKKGVDIHALWWLLLWGFIPLLGTFLISLIKPIFQLRTVLTAAPAFYLLVAWGVTRSRHRQINTLLLMFVLVLMMVSLFNLYFNPVFAKPPWREAAAFVEQQVQSGDVVVHTSPGSYLPFKAYPHTVEHVMLPNDPELVQDNAPSQSIGEAVAGAPVSVDEAVQGYRRAWLVVGLDQAVGHQQRQKAIFDSRYQLLAEDKVGAIYIFLYTLITVDDSNE